MLSIGFLVLLGFIIIIEICQEYNLNGNNLLDGFWEEVIEGLWIVEEDMGVVLGDFVNFFFVLVCLGVVVSN